MHGFRTVYSTAANQKSSSNWGICSTTGKIVAPNEDPGLSFVQLQTASRSPLLICPIHPVSNVCLCCQHTPSMEQSARHGTLCKTSSTPPSSKMAIEPALLSGLAGQSLEGHQAICFLEPFHSSHLLCDALMTFNGFPDSLSHPCGLFNISDGAVGRFLFNSQSASSTCSSRLIDIALGSILLGQVRHLLTTFSHT